MLATIINAVLILAGSILGICFQNRIGARFNAILTHALGLCVTAIGMTSAIATENTLCVIVCMVVGTVLGEAVDIERRLDGAGELLRRRLTGDGPGTDRGVGAASLRGSLPPPFSFVWGPWPLWGLWRRASMENMTFLSPRGSSMG